MKLNKIKFISAAVATVLMMTSVSSFAYYDTTDKAEAYLIKPNETAFWIPDNGDNVSSQSKLNSSQYLESHKVAAKRFIIPHAKFNNSGGWSFDAYVPTGRLILVDRSQYARDWTVATRGTSNLDESIPCQTKEGLNYTISVNIGASITEDQVAQYLYTFGVLSPKGSDTDPAVIFTSVFYGRPLNDVMDKVIHKNIEGLMCHEVASRGMDQANADMNIMMDNVRKQATEYMASVGITLDFIGYSNTVLFDPEVQKAINDRYVAQTISTALPLLQAQADIKVKEGLSQGLATHGLPSNLIAVPEASMGGLGLGAILNTTGAPKVPATK